MADEFLQRHEERMARVDESIARLRAERDDYKRVSREALDQRDEAIHARDELVEAVATVLDAIARDSNDLDRLSKVLRDAL